MSFVSSMIVAAEKVPLPDVIIRAAIQRLCSRTATRLADGDAESDAAFANEQILVADKIDGKPLFGYQGPLRLTIPGDKAGARSVRMLETIEVVRLLK